MRRPRWLGPYRLLYRISSGGMAEIYRAVRTTPDGENHPVAIKRVLPVHTADPEFIDMLIDEAKISGLIDHPNIVQIYEFGLADESYFMAMEYIEGKDLRSILRRCRDRDLTLPMELGLHAVEQALRGLHSAHELVDEGGDRLEVIHRDISPSNILISVDGRVKLIDFGIAKARHNRAKTQAGVIKGKVRYMSPEQTMGKKLDARSDVFASGVVLYELLCGRVPFQAPDEARLIEAIREQPAPAPSEHAPAADAALDAVLLRALAKNREQRWPSAAAFADELGAYRRRRFPRFEPEDLGRLLRRIFAQELMEDQARFQEYDLDISPDDLTPTGERRAYTQLVNVHRFDEEALDEAREARDRDAELLDEVEGWLAESRETGKIERLEAEIDADQETGKIERLEAMDVDEERDTGKVRFDRDETGERLPDDVDTHPRGRS